MGQSFSNIGRRLDSPQGAPYLSGMTRLDVSIDDDLGAWAEARAAEARAAGARMAGAADYLADLLRRDREHFERGAGETQRLRAAWAEGLASGDPEPVPADWADRVIARGQARRTANR
jgi:hypothetical protein